MSSKTDVARDIAITSYYACPSGAARLALKLLAIISLDPQGRWLMAVMPSSMYKAFYGARYNLTIYYHFPPDAS